jgi:hypothetical protein
MTERERTIISQAKGDPLAILAELLQALRVTFDTLDFWLSKLEPRLDDVISQNELDVVERLLNEVSDQIRQAQKMLGAEARTTQ